MTRLRFFVILHNFKCIYSNHHLLSTGPFWVCATLVVTIAISGNLANYLIHAGDHNWTYDFHKSKKQ